MDVDKYLQLLSEVEATVSAIESFILGLIPTLIADNRDKEIVLQILNLLLEKGGQIVGQELGLDSRLIELVVIEYLEPKIDQAIKSSF